MAPGQIIRDLQKAGFRAVAATIALETLRHKKMVDVKSEFNPDIDQQYDAYYLTSSGIDWIISNQHLLVLRNDKDVVEDLPF